MRKTPSRPAMPVFKPRSKPLLKREWIGRKVRLLHAVENLAKQRFEAGTVLEVIRNHGGLSLKESASTPDKPPRCIKGVRETSVALLHGWSKFTLLPGHMEACVDCGFIKNKTNELEVCKGRPFVGPRGGH
jgi:hypothetical protein